MLEVLIEGASHTNCSFLHPAKGHNPFTKKCIMLGKKGRDKGLERFLIIERAVPNCTF